MRNAAKDAELAVRARDGDRAARDELVLGYLRLARSLARVLPAHLQEDAIQQSVFGLLRAIERYDPCRGAFATHAYWQIRSTLNKFKELSYAVHVSQSCVRRRGPDVPPEFRAARSMQEVLYVGGPTLQEVLVSEGPSPEDQADAASRLRCLDRVLAAAQPRDRQVLCLLARGHSKTTIARRLRVSPQRVHQLQRRAIQRARETLSIGDVA